MTTDITLEQHATAGATNAPALDEVALLTGMLARYTPSGHERPLAEWLRDQLAPLGFVAEVDAVGNLIATLPATVAAPAAPVVLLGHADTVRGYIAPRREGDRLYGRGAVDAKGPLAAFLAAATRLAQRGGGRGRAVIVVGAVEEESATSRGARAVLDRWRPAYVVIGEPSGADAITIGYKGRLLVRCRVEQPVAHTARPDAGVSARAVALWNTLQAQADEWNAAHGAANTFAMLQPSLRAIRSGGDGFTEWCALEVGYRLPLACAPADLQATVERLAAAAGASVSVRGAELAHLAARSGPLVGAFVRAIRAQGAEPSFKRKTGTSDMNVVAPVWQAPILAYGPGDAALDHTPDEHILLAEYARGIAVLERALRDLVAAEGGAQ